jgi:predicted double-glycine peptidase
VATILLSLEPGTETAGQPGGVQMISPAGGRWVVLCGALSAVALGVTTTEAQISVGTGLRVDPPGRSIKDLRDGNLVKQRFDFSCGAAALATILRFGFGEQVTERQILNDLFTGLSPQEQPVVRSTGFSLLHLQRVAQTRGYNAQGFRLEPQQLSLLGGPVIVFITPRGYKHFAVLRGVRDDRVYLADPSRGNIRMPAYAFFRDWLQNDGKGIIFVVEPATATTTRATPLAISKAGLAQPEIMTARELMAIGSSLLRFPDPTR